MDTRLLKEKYNLNKKEISSHLRKFQDLSEDDNYSEFLFCLLTPQSNAHKCWEAVQSLLKQENLTYAKIVSILKTKTRFHNNKANYIMEAPKTWVSIKPLLVNKNRSELRNQIAKGVKGYGLKEASHFLRNIGKSDNQIAILDRHILRNLKNLEIISEEEIKMKNQGDYNKIEEKFLAFSKEVRIPIDHLDLLFWSNETGNLFK